METNMVYDLINNILTCLQQQPPPPPSSNSIEISKIVQKHSLMMRLKIKGRGKFAEIKEIKEISRKSLKNPKMDSSSPNSSRKMITKNFKFFMCIY